MYWMEELRKHDDELKKVRKVTVEGGNGFTVEKKGNLLIVDGCRSMEVIPAQVQGYKANFRNKTIKSRGGMDWLWMFLCSESKIGDYYWPHVQELISMIAEKGRKVS